MTAKERNGPRRAAALVEGTRRAGTRASCLALAAIAALVVPHGLVSFAQTPAPRERIVIDDNFPSGYQVEVVDVNGDQKPDLVALGGSSCVWYENPSWVRRVITGSETSPSIISSAGADLDGDGKAEIAIAYDFEMNTPTRGKLGLAVQKGAGGWEFLRVGDTPSIHRVRWGDFDGDGRLDLVAAPIFGKDAKPPAYEGDAPLTVYRRSEKPDGTMLWQATPAGKFPVMHAIEVIQAGDTGRSEILAATNLGVVRVRMTAPIGATADQWTWDHTVLVTGGAGPAPNRGSSEVHLGRLKDGRRLLATIDPWHGNEVAVYLEKLPRTWKFEPREVLDETLDVGHALWVADVDQDGDDEVFAGHRGKGACVSMYGFDGVVWSRTVIDDQIAAQDLRGGDLDSDGAPDVVAIGGQTKNVVWYRFEKPKGKP